MTDHPLTDYYSVYYDEDDMRAAYDRGRDDQLEQVLAHMAYNWLWLSGGRINELREAMRPTQEDNS